MPEPHVGAVGFAIRVRVTDGESAIDISGATTKQIKLKPPTGALRTVTANFSTDGADGRVEVVTVGTPGDDLYLGVPGHWQVWGYFVTPSWADHTEPGTFYVGPAPS